MLKKENPMRLRSLVPSRDAGMLMRPDFGLFGLHREIDRLFSEFSQGLGPHGQQLVPNIEIAETDKAIEVTAEMPGLERKDVDISLEDDTLTIRGEKKVEQSTGDGKNDKNVQHSERSYGVFLRVLQLPDRKSTRLNSSHMSISYAVFCLKKKNKTKNKP